MSKNGKIIAVAVLVLAIAALTFAVFEFKLSRQHADRYAELAGAAAEIAETLDSGSGVGNSVTYGISEGKETGSLGWPATKGVKGATASAVSPLEDLAGKIVEQRESIVNAVVKRVATPLDCPPARAPKEDALNDVNDYETGLDDFAKYIQARVARDNNIRSTVNDVLRQLNVRGSYSAQVTEDGAFNPQDARALQDGAKNLGALKGNYSKMAQAMRDFSNALRSSRVEGVKWSSPAAAGKIGSTGLTEAESASNQAAIAAFREDLAKVKTQLARIDALEQEKADLEEERDAALKKADDWKKAYENDEEVLKGIMDVITPTGNYNPKKIAGYAEVDKESAGVVMGTNADYGFVVVSLTQGEVIPELRLNVFRKGAYVAMIRVINPTPYNSVAIVEDGKVSDIKRGDTVLVASQRLQKEQFKDAE